MANYPPKPCVMCKINFKPQKISQICCSTKCSYERWQQKKTEWAQTQRKVIYKDLFKCSWCSNKSLRKRSDQGSCGRPSCKMKQANWKNTIRRCKEDDKRRLG